MLPAFCRLLLINCNSIAAGNLERILTEKVIENHLHAGAGREYNMRQATVHTPLSREVFWHEYAKIPRHTSQNSIAAGNLE